MCLVRSVRYYSDICTIQSSLIRTMCASFASRIVGERGWGGGGGGRSTTPYRDRETPQQLMNSGDIYVRHMHQARLEPANNLFGFRCRDSSPLR